MLPQSVPPSTPFSHLGSTLTSSSSQPLTSVVTGDAEVCDCRTVHASSSPLNEASFRGVGVARRGEGVASEPCVRRSPDYGVRPYGNGKSSTPLSIRSLRFPNATAYAAVPKELTLG